MQNGSPLHKKYGNQRRIHSNPDITHPRCNTGCYISFYMKKKTKKQKRVFSLKLVVFITSDVFLAEIMDYCT